MQRISINLKNNCDGNQLNYNNDLPAIGNKNYALQKPFETDFLTIIGNAKLQPSFVICWVAQGTQFYTLTYFFMQNYSQQLFYREMYWNMFRRTRNECWYLLKLSDLFIKNENSVFPILIEKNFEQKIYFCLLKMRSIFFLRRQI